MRSDRAVRKTAGKVLGCSSTTSNTISRAKMGIQLETNRDAVKLKGQYKLRKKPEKRLLATANSAAWEK